MRLFVAIDLAMPEPLVALLGPARPDHFHLTLWFRDGLPAETLPGFVAKVAPAVADRPRFAIELRGLGAFPNPRDPRVVWVGVGRGREEVEALAGVLENVGRDLGIPPDPRPFRAHVTVRRVRGPRDRALAVRWLAEGASVSFGDQVVAEVATYESRLGPGPVEHVVVGRAPLRDPVG